MNGIFINNVDKKCLYIKHCMLNNKIEGGYNNFKIILK